MGEILIADAEPGTYRVFEVDTGDDGHILDTTPQEIELKAGDGIRELVFFNDRLPGIHLPGCIVKLKCPHKDKGLGE